MNKAEGYALRTGRPWKTLQLSTSCLHCLLSRPYRWVSISLLAPDQTPQMTWCPQPLKGCCSERHQKRDFWTMHSSEKLDFWHEFKGNNFFHRVFGIAVNTFDPWPNPVSDKRQENIQEKPQSAVTIKQPCFLVLLLWHLEKKDILEEKSAKVGSLYCNGHCYYM